MLLASRAARSLASMMVQHSIPTLGLKSIRKWVDKRCEKRAAKEGPIPAPTLPLPWDQFRRMPHRLKASRHLDAYVPPSISEQDPYRTSNGQGPRPCRLSAMHNTMLH
jgi:hypothetical protein